MHTQLLKTAYRTPGAGEQALTESPSSPPLCVLTDHPASHVLLVATRLSQFPSPPLRKLSVEVLVLVVVATVVTVVVVVVTVVVSPVVVEPVEVVVLVVVSTTGLFSSFEL
jgi:hypothetical protein